jgi:predicted transcriptional regulator of viral defense system
MKGRLGQLEMRMLAFLQMRRQAVVRTGELTEPLRITRLQERELFRRMSRGGMIARVRRGLYLVPDSLLLAWTPNETLALNTLLADRQGRYQICGLNAFARYGFSEQVPVRVYAYNNRISGDRKVGVVEFSLIKVADRRLGDVEEVRSPSGEVAIYSSRTRTLLDAVYDWSRFNSLPRAYDWIVRELAAKRVSVTELVRVALQYGDVGTVRRIGALLEREGVAARLLRRLEGTLGASSATIPLDPTRPKRGSINPRWGVVWNI